MKTSSAKAKGRRLQQTVRDGLLSRFDELTADDCRSCPMGSQGEDIQLSTAAKALIPYSIECKARARVGLVYDALEQAERGDGLQPLAIIKADRKRPLAVIDLEAFLDLISTKCVHKMCPDGKK